MAYCCRVVTSFKNIHIVGCGGTGSRLVPLIAQFIASLPDKETRALHLYDFDIVEEKNLTRQNFVSIDVGKKKSEVLAARYGAAYGININPYSHSLANPEKQTMLSSNNLREGDIIVLALDSNKARRAHLQYINAIRMRWPGVFLIDSGNEDTFGQIRMMTICAGFKNRLLSNVLQLPEANGLVDLEVMPLPVDSIVSIGRSDSGDLKERSCADLDQTLAINSLMATHIFAILQNIYYKIPLDYNLEFISLSGNPARPNFLKMDTTSVTPDNYLEFSTSYTGKERGAGTSTVRNHETKQEEVVRYDIGYVT